MHKRLIAVIAVHTVLGQASEFLNPVLNYFQPHIMPLAKGSLLAHFGIELDASAYAWFWSIIASADTVGNFVGSAAIWYLLETIGRRDTVMLLRNSLSIVACLLLGFAKLAYSFEMIILARFLTGFCASCSNVLFIYLCECVPHQYRGRASMILGVGGGAWLMVATVIALPQLLGSSTLWPLFMAIPLLPNVLYSCFALVLPRSPKYLDIDRGEREKAKEAIRFYHGDNVDVDQVLKEYDLETKLAKLEDQGNMTYRKIFSTPHFRGPLLVCLVATFAGNMNGQQIAQQYSNAILIMLGIPQDYSLAVILAMGLLASVLGVTNSFYLIDRAGRRCITFVNISLAVCGSLSVFVANLSNDGQTTSDSSSANVVSMGFGVLGFLLISFSTAMGIDAMPKLLLGELCPQASRGRTATLCYLVGNTVTFVQVLAWPPLQQAVGAYSFLPLILGEVLCFVWLWRYMPETKNTAVNEIVARWVGNDAEVGERAVLLQPVHMAAMIGVTLYGAAKLDGKEAEEDGRTRAYSTNTVQMGPIHHSINLDTRLNGRRQSVAHVFYSYNS